jgi:hypothetical protein
LLAEIYQNVPAAHDRNRGGGRAISSSRAARMLSLYVPIDDGNDFCGDEHTVDCHGCVIAKTVRRVRLRVA